MIAGPGIVQKLQCPACIAVSPTFRYMRNLPVSCHPSQCGLLLDFPAWTPEEWRLLPYVTYVPTQHRPSQLRCLRLQPGGREVLYEINEFVAQDLCPDIQRYTMITPRCKAHARAPENLMVAILLPYTAAGCNIHFSS